MYILRKKQQKQGWKQEPTVEETHTRKLQTTMERESKQHVDQGNYVGGTLLSCYVWLKEPNFIWKSRPTWQSIHKFLAEFLWNQPQSCTIQPQKSLPQLLNFPPETACRQHHAWMVGPLVPLPLSDFGSSLLAPGPDPIDPTGKKKKSTIQNQCPSGKNMKPWRATLSL